MAPTPETVERAAREIVDAGTHAAPSLKFALWAASLSGQKDLEANGKQADTLRPYVNAPLPQSIPQVRGLIAEAHGFCHDANAATILYLEWLDTTGQLEPYKTVPQSYRGWLLWRVGLYALCRGHGLSFKMLSFASLLAWPLHSELVIVDRHVAARLGYPASVYERLSANLDEYARIEMHVIQEWVDAGRPTRTVGLWGWLKWSQWRQWIGKEPICDMPQSHALLSPYAF